MIATSLSTTVRHAELHLEDTTDSDRAIVTLGTSLLDVVLQLRDSSSEFVWVTRAEGQLVGVLRLREVFQTLDASIREKSTDNWIERPIESLLRSRWDVGNLPVAALPHQLQPVMSNISCEAVVEGDCMVGLRTPADLFISWNRIAPLMAAASQDPLTGLLNRGAFMQRLDEEWARARRSHRPFALLLIDVDEFKQVNDRCGHLAGDTVLKQMAQCLRQQFRTYDILGRLGGDEFAVVCCDCLPEDVESPLRRVLEAVRALPVPNHFHRERLSISVGLTTIAEAGEGQLMNVIATADDCLYAAKRAGRDCAFRSTFGSAELPSMLC